jgi:hypothetical protein
MLPLYRYDLQREPGARSRHAAVPQARGLSHRSLTSVFYAPTLRNSDEDSTTLGAQKPGGWQEGLP